MKGIVIKVLKKALDEYGVKMKPEEIETLLEHPPDQELGDYAFPCFFLSKTLKMDPSEIAIEIREKIGNIVETDFEDIQTQGPYINFFLNRKSMARQAVWDVIMKKRYGSSEIGKGRRTMVEFSSPNTNKPLHMGHLRNLALGESISRILEFHGEKVIRATLNNDRGIHICKSMLAYQKWGREKTPEEKKIKPDHFVGKFYVMFNKKKTKKLEEEAKELLRKWENKDRNTLLLWKLMNEWALEGFGQTYKTFGVKFDTEFFESKLYKKGKEMIKKGIDDKIFLQTKGGEVILDLKNEGLGEKVLLRSDGTSLYIVQDLALAKIKFEKYKLNSSFYVVGQEQEYHFKVLFSILKKLGFQKDMRHISYGLVNIPSGKLKSREGETVDADDLIEDVRKMAEKELRKREKLSKSELQRRSLVIALSAIKYVLLKRDIRKTVLFNPKESISLEGDTGPYILYSYARASSIMKKSSEQVKRFEINEISKQEVELAKKLTLFPEVVFNAARTLNPSLIANYAYQLSQSFNEYYQSCRVIGSEQETFRLALVQSFRNVLKSALWLLGIETLEEM